MEQPRDTGQVVAVSRSGVHGFSKPNEVSIELLAGVGVAGDTHAGPLVQHRSRVARNPNQANLRQVHLIHDELYDELRDKGFDVGPGQLGENVTTRGLDLLGLPRGTRLHLGATAIVEVTGLRNPCRQINELRPGLMQAVLGRDELGRVIRKAGIMAVVVAGGLLHPDDLVRVELPAPPPTALEPV